MKAIGNVGTAPKEDFGGHPTLAHFQKHLESEEVSKNTIKNYISDVRHFLNWLENREDLGSKI